MHIAPIKWRCSIKHNIRIKCSRVTGSGTATRFDAPTERNCRYVCTFPLRIWCSTDGRNLCCGSCIRIRLWLWCIASGLPLRRRCEPVQSCMFINQKFGDLWGHTNNNNKNRMNYEALAMSLARVRVRRKTLCRLHLHAVKKFVFVKKQEAIVELKPNHRHVTLACCKVLGYQKNYTEANRSNPFK